MKYLIDSGLNCCSMRDGIAHFAFKLSTEVEKQIVESDAHHTFGFENSFPQCNCTPSSVKALNTRHVSF